MEKSRKSRRFSGKFLKIRYLQTNIFFLYSRGSPLSSESGEVYFFTLFSYGYAYHLLLLESSDNDIISLVWSKIKDTIGVSFIFGEVFFLSYFESTRITLGILYQISSFLQNFLTTIFSLHCNSWDDSIRDFYWINRSVTSRILYLTHVWVLIIFSYWYWLYFVQVSWIVR